MTERNQTEASATAAATATTPAAMTERNQTEAATATTPAAMTEKK